MAQPAERLEFQDYFGANYQTAYEAKPRTVVEKEPSMTVVKPRKLTFAERKQEEKLGNRRWFKATAILCVLFILGSLNIAAMTYNDNYYREIQELKYSLELKQSEYDQINAKLNSLVSYDRVEQVAVEQLGLIKIDSADWEYINLMDGNSIVVSQAD